MRPHRRNEARALLLAFDLPELNRTIAAGAEPFATICDYP
jgi:hypothetical protein